METGSPIDLAIDTALLLAAFSPAVAIVASRYQSTDS
jgi:hypothetical protein